MKGVRGVVFDIDDTLYLERDYVWSGFRAVGEFVSQQIGMPDFANRAWTLFTDGMRGNIFDQVLLDAGQSSAIDVAVLVDVYRHHKPDIVLLPDASQCLQQLVGKVQLACVTGGPVESQRAKVEALGLEAFFPTVVFTGSLGASFEKPHPRGFEMVEEALGLSGDKLVYVGDNPAKDFAGPRALGWKTIRIRRAGSLHERIPSPGFVNVEAEQLPVVTDIFLKMTRK